MKIIGIIVRGKHSEQHDPEVLEQHADVILSDGSPVGYFGEGGGFSGNVGMFMDGVVYDYNLLSQYRPYYVDSGLARRHNVLSTACTIVVEDEVAKKFDEYWRYMDLRARVKKDGFSLLGNNCSTHAAEAFAHAGVMEGGIPGLDTPQNLYHSLKMRYGARFQCASGYVGFKKRNTKLELEILSP